MERKDDYRWIRMLRASEGVTNGHVILLLTIVIRDRRHDVQVDESKVYRRHPSCYYNCYNKNLTTPGKC